MSWANIRELLFQERKMLDPAVLSEIAPDSAFETPQSALLGSYLKTKAQVDSAIRSFAQTLEWPELSPLEKFFLVARLDFAWEVVSILNTGRDRAPLISYPSPERCTTAELLEWLLIDVWPYGCSRFLQAQKWVLEEGTFRKQDSRSSALVGNAKCVA